MTFIVAGFENATSLITVSGSTCRFGAYAARNAALVGSGSTGWPGGGT
jgi:predicted nucleotide-binding protein (sugar kinase/HSP70/actin superfamily)